MVKEKKRRKPPTVVDLFCGAGGFSEGFHQAGFDIIEGWDIWEDARSTFNYNFPTAKTRGGLIHNGWKKISTNVDVIIGGPPCVEFSQANKWGNGNIEEGLKHVKLFFEYVNKLEPKVWVMENVPRLKGFLEEEITNFLPRNNHDHHFAILNSENFGDPQKRTRMFISNINLKNLEKKKIEKLKTLGEIINCLNENNKHEIFDINYPTWPTIKVDKISDQFHLIKSVELNAVQIKKCKDLKQNHGYAGKMEFPDKLDRPSRTIMATQTFSSRETMVIKDINNNKFRALTIRENASLQGFPISFQFVSQSNSSKYKLVGNAVPIGMARAIGNEIRKHIGLQKIKPIKRNYSIEITEPLQPKIKRKIRLGKRFQWHTKGSRIGPYRVDLDNTKPPNYKRDKTNHECYWNSVIHVGIGKNRHEEYIPNSKEVWGAFKSINLNKKIELDILGLITDFHGTIPDATTLLWAHRNPKPKNWKTIDGISRPRFILHQLDQFINKIIEQKNENIDCKDYIKICPDKGIPVKTIINLFILHWLCREINHCPEWVKLNPRKVRWIDNKIRISNISRRKCYGVMSKDFPEK